MNAKEFLQMEKQVEQLVAFQTIMKGELAQELKETKDALKLLEEAKDIAKAKQVFLADKEAFEKYKATANQYLSTAEEAIKARQESLATQEAKLLAKNEQTEAAKAELNMASSKLKNEQYLFEQTKAAELAKLKQDREDLNSRLDKFQTRIDAVIARENALDKKLALLKEV